MSGDREEAACNYFERNEGTDLIRKLNQLVTLKLSGREAHLTAGLKRGKERDMGSWTSIHALFLGTSLSFPFPWVNSGKFIRGLDLVQLHVGTASGISIDTT